MGLDLGEMGMPPAKPAFCHALISGLNGYKQHLAKVKVLWNLSINPSLGFLDKPLAQLDAPITHSFPG